MRQAGRSLPEYRALRESHDILQICRTPELAAEVTLQPVRRLGVDAAILFSDIVVPLHAMGIDVEIRPGVGPVIDAPIRSSQDVERIKPLDPDAGVPFVLEAVRILVKELDVPLIGFGGAPFTLASYLVEGGPSRNHVRTKTLMYSDESAWTALMDVLADAVIAYLRAQVEAGAGALQLFDSWVGALTPSDYSRYVLPSVTRIFASLRDLDVPTIYFGLNSGELLPVMARSGASVLGVDWHVPLDDARSRVEGVRAIQGNLDPVVCLAPWEVARERALDALRRGGGKAHVFNLGHGVLPQTDPDILLRLVELVHGWEPESADA
jgi:uroporphyrinogen decarboxylase